MSETPKQSDQLPEEAPAEQVPDDVGEAGEGPRARRASGSPDASPRTRATWDTVTPTRQTPYETPVPANAPGETEDERGSALGRGRGRGRRRGGARDRRRRR